MIWIVMTNGQCEGKRQLADYGWEECLYCRVGHDLEQEYGCLPAKGLQMESCSHKESFSFFVDVQIELKLLF